MFSPKTVTAIKEHALSEYPRESCGVVLRNGYKPCTNAAERPEEDFLITAREYARYKSVRAIVHSHTNGKWFPSKMDMQNQIAMQKPWGIVCTDGQHIQDLFWWGDGAPIAPLIGRQFRHGVSDCFALVRDWYKAEKNIILPAYAREDGWWDRGENMFTAFGAAGFKLIDRVSEPGDCVVGKVLGPVPNHCGVYVGNGLVLHHLSNRLSRVEPLGPWLKYVTHHLRYVGSGGKQRVRRKK